MVNRKVRGMYGTKAASYEKNSTSKMERLKENGTGGRKVGTSTVVFNLKMAS